MASEHINSNTVSNRANAAVMLFVTEQHINELYNALHAYRYACGQYRDTEQALVASDALTKRYMHRAEVLAVVEDMLAYIAVEANKGR